MVYAARTVLSNHWSVDIPMTPPPDQRPLISKPFLWGAFCGIVGTEIVIVGTAAIVLWAMM
jgi:hypothetical protein